MKSLLRQLYAGEIRLAEKYESLTEEYVLKRSGIMVREKEFYKTLNDMQKIEFIRILDEHTGLIPNEAESIYLEGMRMGAQLMRELLEKRPPKPDLTGMGG